MCSEHSCGGSAAGERRSELEPEWASEVVGKGNVVGQADFIAGYHCDNFANIEKIRFLLELEPQTRLSFSISLFV
jgi:hypothetical protein